ncbi:hypothetical protein NQD34_013680 [Periophthalmus magnuspinnatus]|nr:hypothetical protein NQD34_013680 [Periophthalmus magnuspinnatus]
MTERTRSWIQVAEMGFLRRVVGHTLTDRVRSLVTWEELSVEPLLLHGSRGTSSSGSGICSGCLLDASLGRCSGHVPSGAGPGKTQDTLEGLCLSAGLEDVSVVREVSDSLLRLLPPLPSPR